MSAGGDDHADAPLVDVRHAGVAFGARWVLRDVTFSVRAGERVAVIGPSGAGKSTLLGLCSSQVAASEGSVRVDGVEVEDSDRWRRVHGRRVATIPQDLQLMARLRVLHNVNAGRLGQWSTGRALWSLARPGDDAEVTAVLAEVGLADHLHRRVERLSGGERQRVAIARALHQRADLVVADEPTANLDPVRATDVMDLLAARCAAAGRALLVSQHDVALATRCCDRVIGLRDGALVFDLPAADVRAEHTAALYGAADGEAAGRAASAAP